MYVAGGCPNFSFQTCVNNVYNALTSPWAPMDDVYRAPILADGSLGAWTQAGLPNSGNLPTTLYSYKAGVYNSYYYIVGGRSGGGGGASITSTVYYARINSDGSMSGSASNQWLTTTSLPSARADFAMSISSGYMYVSGGYVGGAEQNDTIYAQINADGTLGTWRSSGATLSPAVADTTSVAIENGLVVLGGNDGLCAGNNCLRAQYASFKSAGELHSDVWVNGQDIGNIRSRSAAAVYGGYVYIVGGCRALGCSTEDLGTQRAQINADGTLGAFSSALSGAAPIGTNMSQDRKNAAAVAHDGYLYVIGGETSDGGQDGAWRDIEVAQIKADGTIGPWSTSGSLMAKRRGGVSAAVSNGYLFVAGGSNNTDGLVNTVEYAPLTAGVIGTWETATDTLNTPRAQARMVVLGSNLYIAGGYGNPGDNTVFSSVEYATIGAGDHVSGVEPGVWNTSASTMNTARRLHGLSVYNGHIYAYGGYSDKTLTTQTPLNSVEYASITPTGDIGVWQPAVTTLPDARAAFAYAQIGGVLHQLGGSDNNYQNTHVDTSSYQYINNGGSGKLANWSTGTTTGGVTTRSAHATVAYNGYLYMAGGCGAWSTFLSLGLPYCTAARANIYRAPLNADGSLGTWAATTTGMPPGNALYTFYTMVAHDGYLYMAGGGTGGTVALQAATPIKSVKSIQINATTGDISGSWTDLPDMNTARFGIINSSAVLDGRWYVAGGCTSAGSGCVNTIEFATFQPNGGLSGWEQNGNQTFATARNNHGLVVNGNYLYIIGGCPSNCASGLINDVEYTEITDTDGYVTNPWKKVVGEEPIGAGGVYFAYNGYLYAVASLTASTPAIVGANAVLFAPLLANGAVGKWTHNGNTAASLIGDNRIISSGAVWGGRIYVTGGTPDVITASAVNAYANSKYATIQSIPRIGLFSKLYDFGSGVKPTKLITRGTKQAGAKVGINYTTAAKRAQEFTVTTPLLGGLTSPNHGLSNDDMVTLETTGTLPSSSSSPGHLAKNTVYYANVADANSFILSTGPGGSGFVIQLSGGSGTHSFIRVPPEIVDYRQGIEDIGFTGANGHNIVLAANNTLTDYLNLRYTIDDTYSAVFPDAGNETTITDFDMYYIANPGKRLRGGRTFTQGQDRGLDVQPQ